MKSESSSRSAAMDAGTGPFLSERCNASCRRVRPARNSPFARLAGELNSRAAAPMSCSPAASACPASSPNAARSGATDWRSPSASMAWVASSSTTLLRFLRTESELVLIPISFANQLNRRGLQGGELGSHHHLVNVKEDLNAALDLRHAN